MCVKEERLQLKAVSIIIIISRDNKPRRHTGTHTALKKHVVRCGCWMLARDHEFVKQHNELVPLAYHVNVIKGQGMERTEDGEMSLK